MWFWWAIGQVLAAPVVFDDGSADEALREVSQRTGLPASQLEPAPLDDLLAAPPTALGQAALRHCAGAPTRGEDIRSEQRRAELAWVGGDPAAAMDHLDLAVVQLGCLEELVEPVTAARMFMLRAGLLAHADRDDEAREEIRSALSFVPEMGIPTNFPLAASPLLTEIQAEAPDRELALAPPGRGSGPWLDGAAVDGDAVVLRPGLHLIQAGSTAGITSWWLTVGGDAALILPGGFRRPVLDRAASPDRADELALLIAGALDAPPAAYVVHGGGIWLITASEGEEGAGYEVTTLQEPPANEEPRRRWWQRRKQTR